MLSPVLVAAMEKLVHDYGLRDVADAYDLAEVRAWERAIADEIRSYVDERLREILSEPEE